MSYVPVFIARCPEHGLHGERTHCYECGVEAEQVALVPAAERDRLRDAIEDHRATAESRDHASVRDQELWEALDA